MPQTMETPKTKTAGSETPKERLVYYYVDDFAHLDASSVFVLKVLPNHPYASYIRSLKDELAKENPQKLEYELPPRTTTPLGRGVLMWRRLQGTS